MVDDLQRVALPGAERHACAVLAAQRDGLAVVVPVHVRDEEAPHVAGREAELAEQAAEHVARGVDRPAAVDEGQLCCPVLAGTSR